MSDQGGALHEKVVQGLLRDRMPYKRDGTHIMTSGTICMVATM